MKSNTFQMSLLFDFYGDLLTEKQKELFDLYYNEDFSLTEIAEHAGISRQGARDAIVRGESILRDCEDKLGFVRRYAGYEGKLDEIEALARRITASNSLHGRNQEIRIYSERISQLISEIK